MPMFEYLCSTCGHRFEKLQKTTAAGQVICPQCDSADVKKQLSAFSSQAGQSTPPSCHGGGG